MDGRGVLGFPVRLGIAFLIIALFVPSVVAVAEHYSDESEGGSAKEAADTVFTVSARLWYSGAGSSERVVVDVPAGYELVFGGEGGYMWSYSVEKDGRTVSRTYPDSPSVRYPEEFRISGHAELTLACEKSSGVYGIVVL